MIPRWLVATAALLAPYEPTHQTRPVLDAIWHASHVPVEVAVMLAIEYHENTIGRAGVPFGACGHLCSLHCTHCRTEPLRATARVVHRIWRRSGTSRGCGAHSTVEQRLRYYHSGGCAGWQTDGFALLEAATVERILARDPRRVHQDQRGRPRQAAPGGVEHTPRTGAGHRSGGQAPRRDRQR